MGGACRGRLQGSTDVSEYSGLVHRGQVSLVYAGLYAESDRHTVNRRICGQFYVFGATVQHQHFWSALFALAGNVAIGAYDYMRVVRQMFFCSC